MAGTLTISTLSDGANSTSSTNCIRGSAKAFANFSAASGSILVRNSYNISSITRYATGRFTLSFSNTFAVGDEYIVASSVDGMSFSPGPVCCVIDGSLSPSSFNVSTGSTVNFVDPVYVYVTVFA